MGSIFRFKEFEVDQSDCAMKINTDGVILGAIAQANQPLKILDIGTGTGVIAMMLAQRFPEAQIDAVEIDEKASTRASYNFRCSAFKNRLQAYHEDVIAFKGDGKYDLIVSNPPYFVNDLKNAGAQKSLARHADKEFFKSLALKVSSLLSDAGICWMILPVKQADFMVEIFKTHDLSLHTEINIHSDVQKPVILKVIALSVQPRATLSQNFFIYEAEGIYTQAYKTLLKDFFLAF